MESTHNRTASPRWPLLRALRPHQWAKNVLVFVPLGLAHAWDNGAMWLAAGVAFVCLSMCASALYLLNDAADRESDRAHPTKRHRPIAAGHVSLLQARIAAALLLLGGLGGAALWLPPLALLFLAIYVCTTFLYTGLLKRRAIIDVLTLSGLYVVRLLIGGAACGIELSHWTLAFGMFLFLSLAFAKRFAEIRRVAADGGDYLPGRGYEAGDLNLVESFGTSSGYVAVLVLALYVNSPEMSEHYRRSWPLWLICPLLVYWISRVWIWAQRGKLSEDPVVFALTDWVSLTVAVLVLGLLLLAGI